MKYRAEIDGLRALAIIPVILYHAGFDLFGGGYVGVDVFFVISGYLITTTIIAELNTGTFSVIRFYENRVRRILPALYLVMFVCLPFAWVLLLPSAMKSFSESLIATSTFSSNIFFWRQIGYFDTAIELKPLIHTWSLAVEAQYYVLFPLFLMVLWKLGNCWIIGLLAVIALSSLGLAQWGSIQNPAATFFLLPTRGWELLIGALISFYPARHNIKKLNHNIKQLGSLIGLLLILYSIITYNDKTPYPSVYALLPTLGTSLIIVFAGHKTAVGKLLSSKPLVAVGLISYSAYLWHQPMLAFARNSSLEPSLYLMCALSILSFAFAYLSWIYVEKPFRNKQRISGNKIFFFSILCTTLFIGIGLIANISNGFLYRYGLNDRHIASLNERDAGHYVQKRFTELSMRQFDSHDKRLKVLIIGDSYGQDLVNALYESGHENAIQISTRYISSRCGNLFIERSLFINKISDSDRRSFCSIDQNKDLFVDDKLRLLMLSADEIWFASAWEPWQAELMRESINNVLFFSQKTIKVFGKKDFGEIQIKKILDMDPKDRAYIRGHINEDSIKVNAFLENQLVGLPKTTFINLQKLLCGDDMRSCPLFTEEESLISYDGKHLTKSGARYCGDKLFKTNLIK